jgi:hypothetical protein
MKLRALALALAISCGYVVTTSCGNPPSANTPPPVVSPSDKLGQDLYVLEQSIDAAKTNIASYPQFKAALNKVITTYNTANDAYQAYLKTKAGDLVGLQSQVAQALADIRTFQAAGVKQP